jgi:hypothetical protein
MTEILQDNEFCVFLNCYKQKYATFKCIESIRLYYPKVQIFLHSDNGDDYNDLVEYFKNITYIHHIKSTFSMRPGDTSPLLLNYDNYVSFCARLKTTCRLTSTEIILFAEDDLILRGPIYKRWSTDIAGPHGMRGGLYSMAKYIKAKNNISVSDVGYGGCGGTILKKSSLVKAIDNFFRNYDYEYIMKNIENRFCYTDCFLTSTFLMIGLNYGPSLNHSEKTRRAPDPDHEFNGESLMHYVKDYYNIPFDRDLLKQ